MCDDARCVCDLPRAGASEDDKFVWEGGQRMNTSEC